DRAPPWLGEGLEQRDVSVVDRWVLPSPYQDYSNGGALAQQRRRKRGAVALALCVPAAYGVLAVLCGEIMDMNRPTITCGPSNHGLSVCGNCLAGMAGRRNFPVRSHRPKNIFLQP